MLKKYDGINWNTVSYGKYFLGTEQFTNFPLVIRSLDQSVQAYTIKGNTQTSGTPSPSNPITIEGVGVKTANLFNKETALANTAISDSSGNTFNANGLNASDYINVSGMNKVSITNTLVSRWAAFYDTNKVFVSGFNGYGTINVPQNAAYMRITVTDAYLDSCMANEGNSLLPFEPYGYKILILKGSQALTPIYLNEPLMKIGNILDEVNSDGTVTRRIGKIDLGTLNWHLSASYNGVCDSTVPNMRIINNTSFGNAICTSFVEVNADSVASTSYGFSSCLNVEAKPYINHTGFEGYTDEQFIEALSGVIMYYVLATPTTESVTAPSIPTTGGAATIDVDTTVKPSEVSLTYNGKHLNKSKKFSVGNNLIPYPYYQGDGTVAGVTWTTYSDGRIVGTGKTKDEVQFKLADSLILSSGTYTISITGTHTGMSLLVRNKDNYTQVARIQGNDTSPVTFTISEEGRYEIYYNVLSYNVNVDIDCYIMLNLGSSALPYEPYGSWT